MVYGQQLEFNFKEKETGECKVVNFAEYNNRKALIGILSRPSAEEQIKAQEEKALRERFYALSDHLDEKPESEQIKMKVVESDESLRDRFFRQSDHLDDQPEAKVIDLQKRQKIKLTNEILKNTRSF